jgi:hypothetical protein
MMTEKARHKDYNVTDTTKTNERSEETIRSLIYSRVTQAWERRVEARDEQPWGGKVARTEEPEKHPLLGNG